MSSVTSIVLAALLTASLVAAVPPPPRNAGDLTGDGMVDEQDVFVLASSWGACEAEAAWAVEFTCPADLDGDGHIDMVDLLTLLSLVDTSPSVVAADGPSRAA